MKTLADAWRWYRETQAQLQLLRRLGRRYWKELPWGGAMGRDEAFFNRDPEAVQAAAESSLAHLDDLAVVVLFSVFESAVRHRTGEEVDKEAAGLRHPAMKGIAKEAKERIEVGSFFKVLEFYKEGIDPTLVEQVNQVRRYRNWVAHGKRGLPVANVDPDAAFERLGRFLKVLGI